MKRIALSASSLLLSIAAACGANDGPEQDVRSQAITEQAAIAFDFEDGTAQGFAVGWGGAFAAKDPAVLASHDLSRAGNVGALRVELAYTGGSWEEANIQANLLASGDVPSLSAFERVEYDVYVPATAAAFGIFKMELALNDPWNELGAWSDYDIASTETVSLAGSSFHHVHRVVPLGDAAAGAASRQVVLRFAAYQSTYQGPIYVDDVRFVPRTGPSLQIRSPDSLVSVAGSVELRVNAVSSAQDPVVSVRVRDDLGRELELDESEAGVYAGALDSRALLDGLNTLTFIAETAQGEARATREVWVDNSALTLSILEPALDQTTASSIAVRARVLDAAPDAHRFVVLARIGGQATPLKPAGSGEYVGRLDVRHLADRAYTLVVEARRGSRLARRWTEVAVDNVPNEPFVVRKGADFFAGKRPFSFAGFNAYDLPFKYESTLSQIDKRLARADDGAPLVELVPAGTRVSFEAQVDRTMIEASKLGMTVVRTWAFNSDVTSDRAYYKPDFTLNEPQLARLDYVLDSARRHGLRVLLTLENYWDHYGGIAATAARFNVPKLAFFSDPRCQAMFRSYIAALVSRKNTRSGRLYRDDPTIFAWELMNEPRMDVRDDTSADKSLYDPTGDKLGAWFESTARYLKSIDPNHMVAPGSEGHGYRGWGSSMEGYGTDPLRVMDQPSIDFFTFHPYLNETWSRMTVGEAKTLITGFVNDAIARNKPVIMEEWGFNKHEPVLDLFGEAVDPSHPRYDHVRGAWYDLIGATLRREGGNAQLVWMLQTSLQERNFGVTLYAPFDAALADRPLAAALANQAYMMRELGRASFVRDAKPGKNSWSGYIHEAVFTGLMYTDFFDRFWPTAPATHDDLRSVLEGLGLDASAVESSCARMTMNEVGRAVYDALGLSAWGSDVQGVLARFDLLPQHEHGTMQHERTLSRAELASLALRISDFLLYQ